MQFDIRRFDVYRKVPKDLTQPTYAGACISIFSILFITFLFVSELLSFITTEIVSELIVDDPVKSTERIPVRLNITLPKMECKYVGLDIQDDMGRHEVGMVTNTERIPIEEGQGCRFETHFQINKVPGNFHVSTHAASEQPSNPDMSHIINEVVFGDIVLHSGQVEHIKLPDGSFNPLKDRKATEASAETSHDYFMKVVPTVYQDLSGTKYYPFQYTYAYRNFVQYSHSGSAMPAIWFRYDLSPITAKYIEKRMPVYQFLTAVCAIVGGTFTVAGIIDSVFFTASELFKKAQLGKLS